MRNVSHAFPDRHDKFTKSCWRLSSYLIKEVSVIEYNVYRKAVICHLLVVNRTKIYSKINYICLRCTVRFHRWRERLCSKRILITVVYSKHEHIVACTPENVLLVTKRLTEKPFVISILSVLPYFVYNGGSTGCTDSHGHDSPGNSNSSYHKHLRNAVYDMLEYILSSEHNKPVNTDLEWN